jgi:hypothetical protein
VAWRIRFGTASTFTAELCSRHVLDSKVLQATSMNCESDPKPEKRAGDTLSLERRTCPVDEIEEDMRVAKKGHSEEQTLRTYLFADALTSGVEDRSPASSTVSRARLDVSSGSAAMRCGRSDYLARRDSNGSSPRGYPRGVRRRPGRLSLGLVLTIVVVAFEGLEAF